ncbi:MAG: PKD domain-containing protein, partial [Planctomycetota bacterium]|nr:PKD domain-containing protein [Planctomycetota bacterium]
VSHAETNQATGGDGSSQAPSLDSSGAAVAFESDASDLIAGDTNGVRDVFYADVTGFAPFAMRRASVSDAGAEATGGASGSASVYVASGGRTLVAFQSDASNLAPSLGATSNVYLYDSSQGVTALLNQRRSATEQAAGDGDAASPVIGPNGAYVAFASASANIDVLRPNDENGVTDVFLVDAAQALSGNVLPYRYSLTTVEAADANGASGAPSFGTFASSSSSFGVGFSVYQTTATNLGNADSTDLIVTFLDETSGVLADFTVDATSGAAPLTVQFTDASAGTPTEWEWDFDGDGVADSTEQNPAFTYASPGTYSVRLTASNTGTSSSVTKADLITAVGLPTAGFTGAPTSGTAPLTVNFSDQSTGDPTIWEWDFGDGTAPVFAQDPSHVYATPGQYTVRLKVTNVAGSTDETKTDYITVFAPVSAGFTATPTTGTVPFSVNFTNTSTG